MKTLGLAITLIFSLHAYAFDLAEQEEFTGLPEESLATDDPADEIIDLEPTVDPEEDSSLAPPAPGPGGMTCAAYARRGENHREGHMNCRQCERRHGRCYESCGRRTYQVEVIGEVFRFNDRVKVWRRFVATGPNRQNVEERAMRECRWARADRCHVNRVGVAHREFRRTNC